MWKYRAKLCLVGAVSGNHVCVGVAGSVEQHGAHFDALRVPPVAASVQRDVS
jgi:hypothetical protein